MDNKTHVYSTSQEHNAILLKDQLTKVGIEAIILDQKETVSSVIGGFQVYVDETKLEEAKKIVAEFDHE
jgi:hypothetical protein